MFRRSKDGDDLEVAGGGRTFKREGNRVRLALDAVRRNDAGIYRIEARNPYGMASRDVELRVTAPAEGPDDGEEAPAFLRRLNDLSAKVGTRTRFLVEIKSATDLTVREREIENKKKRKKMSPAIRRAVLDDSHSIERFLRQLMYKAA